MQASNSKGKPGVNPPEVFHNKLSLLIGELERKGVHIGIREYIE